MTIGFNPASTKRYVAKIPLGPYPTTIGLISLSIMVALVSIGLYKLTVYIIEKIKNRKNGLVSR